MLDPCVLFDMSVLLTQESASKPNHVKESPKVAMIPQGYLQIPERKQTLSLTSPISRGNKRLNFQIAIKFQVLNPITLRTLNYGKYGIFLLMV